MWRCEDVESADVKVWRCRSADMKVRRCRSADVKVRSCRSADVKVWRCRSADVKVWGCRSADVKVWGCRSADVKVWRCRSADVKVWGCRSADVKMWRGRSADVLQRLLFYEEPFTGALGKNTQMSMILDTGNWHIYDLWHCFWQSNGHSSQGQGKNGLADSRRLCKHATIWKGKKKTAGTKKVVGFYILNMVLHGWHVFQKSININIYIFIYICMCRLNIYIYVYIYICVHCAFPMQNGWLSLVCGFSQNHDPARWSRELPYGRMMLSLVAKFCTVPLQQWYSGEVTGQLPFYVFCTFLYPI